MLKNALVIKEKQRGKLGEMTVVNSLQDPITSRQNKVVKQVCGLLEKKERRAAGLFRFDGIKLLCEAVQKGLRIENVIISDKVRPAILSKVEELDGSGMLDKVKVTFVCEDVFLKMSEENSPEGIITVAAFPSNIKSDIGEAEKYFVDGKEKIILAESLRDPGNLGTVIRSAAALGIDRLIITDDCADLYNPKTVRAAMGAIFSLKIDVVGASELPKLILSLREAGRKIYAAALAKDAKKIGEMELVSGDAFVIGNEGHGLSQAVIEASDGSAIIPMSEGSESLNAAAAAAICIWETVRVSK